ncbi:hypothetical protein PR048_013798 [Dryococelus australis]|uniref:Integrase catalytic domain-containing protein n=1 Tax=Dryococelus australis TaxID=614101 RepID=A0ABQ9HT65_9NEOP|nr:hypothetical protein PR048_013798 [Dryococelus australis]
MEIWSYEAMERLWSYGLIMELWSDYVAIEQLWRDQEHGRNRPMVCSNYASQHSSGVSSGNHGIPKSDPPECESSELPLSHLTRNWCYRMKLLLEHNGVLHVLSTEPPTTEADLKKFKQEDVKARNILVQGLADNMLPMILGKNTAKGIPTTYEKTGNEIHGDSKESLVKTGVQEECLQQFESMASEVKVAGRKLNEDEMINQLLVAMLSDFDSVVSAMEILRKRLLKKDVDPHDVFASYRSPKGESGQYSQPRHTKGSNVPVLFVIDGGASCHIIKSSYKKYLSEGSDVNFDISVAKAGELLKAVSKGNITCFSDEDHIKINDDLVCDNLSFNLLSVHKKRKDTKLPYLKTIPGGWKEKRVLQYVSTDVCGKITHQCMVGVTISVTFIDHCSHFCVTYLLINKSEVFEKFKMYTAMVEAKFNGHIENLRCDRGGEYVSSYFKRFCDVKGSHVRYSMAKNPSQNCVVERMNRTLLEKTRCLLLDSNFAKEMWGEAIMTATYLSNRLTTSALPKGVTPAEKCLNHKHNLAKIKSNYTAISPPDSVRHTATPEGVSPESTAENRDVCHNSAGEDTHVDHHSQFDNEGDFIGFPPEEVRNEPTITRPYRAKLQPKYLADFELNFAVDILALSVSTDAPDCYEDAFKDVGWRQAINEELTSLESNRFWEVVEIPPDVPVVDSRWYFSTESIEGTSKKKARLVTRDHQQPTLENEDILHDDVTSPAFSFCGKLSAATTRCTSDCDTLTIFSYFDADYASDTNDRKSNSGFMRNLNQNVICWSSKKQSVGALSNSESEYYAIVNYKIAKSLETKRSKHFDILYHFAKDLVGKGKVKLNYVETAEY